MRSLPDSYANVIQNPNSYRVSARTSGIPPELSADLFREREERLYCHFGGHKAQHQHACRHMDVHNCI